MAKKAELEARIEELAEDLGEEVDLADFSNNGEREDWIEEAESRLEEEIDDEIDEDGGEDDEGDDDGDEEDLEEEPDEEDDDVEVAEGAPSVEGPHVHVFNRRSGAYVRTFSEEVHGDDYEELAQQFAQKREDVHSEQVVLKRSK